MKTHHIPLLSSAPGVSHRLQVLEFGPAGDTGGATIQAALHADEVPAMLVAQALRRQLQRLEDAGTLLQRVRLIPAANPVGLSQLLLGQHVGRFALADGMNFNRGYPDLTPAARAAVADRLGSDPAANSRLVQQALQDAAHALPATTTVSDLKRRLLQHAVGSDVVLDLHCDAEAAVHLYALTPHEAPALELAALLGARALLLSTESGDSPFDEACSRPWLQLQQALGPAPLPLQCFCATVELRGQCDTSHALAESDADALVEFLRRRGIVAGAPRALPANLCRATPLAGSEPITAPAAGVLVFKAEPGQALQAGDAVADLVDVDSGAVQTLVTQSAGVLYARCGSRWAEPGQRIAKVAGTTLVRTGKLLSP